jgi:hypothetical protein
LRFRDEIVFDCNSGVETVSNYSNTSLVDIAKNLHSQGARIVDVTAKATDTCESSVQSVIVTIIYEAKGPVEYSL